MPRLVLASTPASTTLAIAAGTQPVTQVERPRAQASAYASRNPVACLVTILAIATTGCGPDKFIPIKTGTFPITFTATGTSQGTDTPITHNVTIDATIAP